MENGIKYEVQDGLYVLKLKEYEFNEINYALKCLNEKRERNRQYAREHYIPKETRKPRTQQINLLPLKPTA